MSEVERPQTADPYLESLKSARSSPAVLKIRLASLRSSLPRIAIFAFEGDEDKIIYRRWLGRIRPRLAYEPFPCGGKKSVRQLKSLLTRDLGGLHEGVYFFVDRDFDDLAGFADDKNVFMTDTYSAENYLVAREVLESLLQNEFPCDGQPERRQRILDLFEEMYARLLKETRDLNFRIYVARKLNIELVEKLPRKFNLIAALSLTDVTRSTVPIERLAVCYREPTIEEVSPLRANFDKLEPKSRYRGKFALMFFQRWLDLLVAECLKSSEGLFGPAGETRKVNRSEFTVGNFATLSPLPRGLHAFVEGIAQ